MVAGDQIPTRGWLMLSYGSGTMHAGNLGYEEDPRRFYVYDSSVANHLQVSVGDIACLAARDSILGLARVENVWEMPARKVVIRCPVCRTTSLKERKIRRPRYRCSGKHDFDVPLRETVDVTRYTAHFGDTFHRLPVTVSISDARNACGRWTGQLSIQRLDPRRLASSRAVEEILQRLGSLSVSTIAAEQAAAAAAGLVNNRRAGQGFLANPEARRAVEHHAMERALSHFASEGWEVRDVSARSPFDLHCRRGGEEAYVEVKGTTSAGETINLTRNEVEFARARHDRMILFLLHSVALHQDSETFVAGGGQARILHPWSPDPSALRPLAYVYTVPPEDCEASGQSPERTGRGD